MPSHPPDNLWRMHVPSLACQFSMSAWLLAWWKANIKGYSFSFYSLGGFCIYLEPPKYSAYSDAELPLWFFGSWTPHVITQLRDS
jgi:hypothetical protein